MTTAVVCFLVVCFFRLQAPFFFFREVRLVRVRRAGWCGATGGDERERERWHAVC